MDVLITIVVALLVAALTFFVTGWYLEKRANSRLRVTQAEADRILEEAETRRRDSAIESKDEAIRLRAE